jgi:hypothetical protein
MFVRLDFQVKSSPEMVIRRVIIMNKPMRGMTQRRMYAYISAPSIANALCAAASV